MAINFYLNFIEYKLTWVFIAINKNSFNLYSLHRLLSIGEF